MSLILNRQEFGDKSNNGNVLSEEEALQLLTEWVPNERLRLHMLQVGYLMKCWAKEREKLLEEDQWRWQLAGLLHDIHAYSLMRPGGYEGMELKGVKKRLKEKSFAAGVSRNEIKDACERAEVELNELIAFIIMHQARDGKYM